MVDMCIITILATMCDGSLLSPCSQHNLLVTVNFSLACKLPSFQCRPCQVDSKNNRVSWHCGMCMLFQHGSVQVALYKFRFIYGGGRWLSEPLCCWCLCCLVCRGARVVSLKIIEHRRRTVVTGMTGQVVGFVTYSTNDMKLELTNRYNIKFQSAEMAEALAACRTICGPSADGAESFTWPEIDFFDPRDGSGPGINMVVVPCLHDEYAKLDDKLIVKRWALPVGGAWALKYGQSLGSTVARVWCDLEGCKTINCNSTAGGSDDRFVSTTANGSPEPFVGLTRVRRVQDCFWALSTPFSATMFKAPDVLLQYYYGTEWVEVETTGVAGGQQANFQALAFR